MQEKNLALFLNEIKFLTYGDEPQYISSDLILNINSFMLKYHNEDKETFERLFGKIIVDQNSIVLPPEVIIYYIHKYNNIEKYLELFEEVDKETEKEINKLVRLFLEYERELVELLNAKPLESIRVYH